MTAADVLTAPAPVAAPAAQVRVGARVLVLTGGYRGELGRVTDTYTRNGRAVWVTTLDSLSLYFGPVRMVTP